MLETTHAHAHETLARGPICTLETCPCGCVHLTLGALTVRLDPGAAESLWTTLGAGLRALGERTRAQRRASARSAS